MSGGVSAWPFRVAVASGLRWEGLLNTDPNTLVLIKDVVIGFAAMTKTRGVSEGRAWGASNFEFPNEKWMEDGHTPYKQRSGNLDRDFWTGQPLFFESPNGFANQSPSFWPNANKMMTIPL